MATSAKSSLAKGASQTRAHDAAPAEPKQRSRLKRVLAPALGLLLLAGGGAAWYLLNPGGSAVPVKHAASKPTLYMPLKLFTVNLQHGQQEQYLQVGLTLKLNEKTAVEALKDHMPDVRNRILLLLSSKSAGQISSVQGKQHLGDEIRQQVVAALDGRVPAHAITGVLFTSFVIQ